ncbi:FAD-dependent monooxygenase [Sinomonas terrae]|uniref:FAD-dependent monooxygenase n=1 Tax=Sinomonas terrae TaxID=2908838 RepID=A0ABS9U253_9MICC|nr:FAD-dependent monooxygenase [Sinomonas terrae]MCH6470764.1 FAD-dependent monooxygenase [Sinomonas terrae]
MLRMNLREAADTHPLVHLRHRVRVVDVGQDESGVSAASDSGERFRADLLIGADGHRSFVRSHVAPERPNADFAGYVIWLGMVEELKLSYPGPRPSRWEMLHSGESILFGIPAPGADGSTAPGRGRIGWAWYDKHSNPMLHEAGAVANGVVQHSVRPEDVPESILAMLEQEASQWSRPWRDAVLQSIADRNVLGTPIAEYVPLRLIAGRLVLVGNAAHVPTPMTGQGFDSSLLDAEALGRALRGADTTTAPHRLGDYDARLRDAQRLVESGKSFSRSYTAKESPQHGQKRGA